MLSPQPKGRKRVTVQRANRRVAAKIVRQVRAACVERDGHCRLFFGDHLHGDTQVGEGLDYCGVRSEWAHLGEKRRFKTRGMPPEERHTVQDSLMLCDLHHDLYDGRTLNITALSDRGANGPLEFRRL